jgi:hypothetical protein
MLTTPIYERLHRWERWAVAVLLLAFLVFGMLVEVRSAFLERRMGDLGCYLRAAWALRTEQNPYDIVEDNLWHYNYPPLYAVLMMPLADPPQGADSSGYVPYSVSVGICYALNVLCLILAMHWLATALESAAGFTQAGLRWSRRWWVLRTLPVIACIPPIGHTLNRGQTNLLMLMLVSGLMAGLMTGRRFRAGICLAAAVCIKVFPAFLFLVPLWRRDGRCLAGCAVGLLFGLLLIPAAAMGPQRTFDAYRDFARVVIGPALGVGSDQSRAEELIDMASTDNQSFQAVISAGLHPNRDLRPRQPSLALRLTSIGIGALLTLLTLWAGRGGRARSGPGLALFVGCLSLVMAMLSPVCHSHYFVLELPLAAALLAVAWEKRPVLNGFYLGSGAGNPLGWGLALLFVTLIVSNALPQLTSLLVLRDRGLPALAALVLWLVAWVALTRRPAARAEVAARTEMPALAA